MRFGVAFPTAFNLPFRRIRAAGLRRYADGSGDIPLALADGDRIAYPLLWPLARPWRFVQTEPMLRGLPDAAHVAEILAARACRRHADARASRPARTPAPAADSAGDFGAGRGGVTGPDVMTSPVQHPPFPRFALVGAGLLIVVTIITAAVVH